MAEQPQHQLTLEDLIQTRLSRRDALRGFAAAGVALLTPAVRSEEPDGRSSLTFREVPHGLDTKSHVAEDYTAQVLIRWGDPISASAPKFDPAVQSAAAQKQQFGYNNDFIAFMPLPLGSKKSDRGLLCVNHEYTVPQLMFPGIADRKAAVEGQSREQADISMAAHGHSVVEVIKAGDTWQVVQKSPYNRRFTMLDTEFRIAGPAAGHARMQTKADPAGKSAIGTLNNCAGGVTPWGTVLSGEENFPYYFDAVIDEAPEGERRNLKRSGFARDTNYGWHKYHDRFDVAKEQNEPNRFGWVVEIDPYNPRSTPVKRTALGRFRHEGATTAVAPDGRVVVYTGDDSKNEYLYKFVTAGKFNPDDREANRNLLDDGTLYVARFNADGTLDWVPLVQGQGPLTADRGFHSQADVVIEARTAADLLGATPMDRPEDVETNPATGHVFLMLTNNTTRNEADAANPRKANAHGHILELIPPGTGNELDHTADRFRWDIFLLAGQPGTPDLQTKYHPDISRDGWLSCPDNCAFDPEGRMWIATDGAPEAAGIADGIYACQTTGPARALTRQFFRGPVGAEICGPYFTPDGKTLFLAVQHPGEDDGSAYDQPHTRWPDFDPRMPPRPAVVAITRKDGQLIGS